MSAKIYRVPYLKQIEQKFGKVKRIGVGYNLFLIPATDTIIYFRYSKILFKNNNLPYTFYGLREDNIELIKKSGKKIYLILLTKQEDKIVFIPLNNYISFFHPRYAKDGQYKVNHYFFKDIGNVVDFSKIARFSTDKYQDFNSILNASATKIKIPKLSHGNLQSLVGLVGIELGYDLFFPKKDYAQIDKNIIQNSKIIDELPKFDTSIDRIVREIDVIWIKDNKLKHFFEVEHSTPIYSGLLRFNDVLLRIGDAKEFNIVAEDERENKFGLEIIRPTFTQNKLNEKTTFISYESIYRKYLNLTGKYYGTSKM